ncbi:MAG TPA: ABC transporter permease [Burkholderiaceae bacterium]|nr:ABC transporter permease [Burkholderiaceae bacterium]
MHRFRFILLRPFELIPVLIGISVITFLLVHFLPGNPAYVLLGPKATDAAVQAIEQKFGLDQPLFIQYFYFLGNLLQGDMGQSVVYKMPVLDVIRGHVSPTIFLIVYGVVLACILSFVMALLAAIREGKLLDHVIRIISTSGLGLPSFWVGVLLMLVFSVRLGLFPVSGFGKGFVGHLHSLFLPALTVAISLTPILVRNLRSSLLREASADYIVSARSKNLPSRIIWIRHIFRNSLVATVNLLGVTTGWLFGGVVVIEMVFSIPGIGHLMVSSIFTRDYLVVEAVTMIMALGIVTTNFVVDIITVCLDPRVDL